MTLVKQPTIEGILTRLTEAEQLLKEIKEHLSDSRRSYDEEMCGRIEAFLKE